MCLGSAAEDSADHQPRKRQAAITAEICEISSAANAIEASDKKGAAGPGLGIMDNEDCPPVSICRDHFGCRVLGSGCPEPLQESIQEDFMKELEGKDVPDEPISYDQFGPATRKEIVKS